MSMKTFYVGVKGLIVRDGKVLLLRSNKAQGRRDMWEAPGGRIDGTETIQQALDRELHEELVNIVDVSIGDVVYATRLPWDIDGAVSLALIFYKVDADFDGDPRISGEHVDWRWCTFDEAQELVNETTLPAIKAAFAL